MEGGGAGVVGGADGDTQNRVRAEYSENDPDARLL